MWRRVVEGPPQMWRDAADPQADAIAHHARIHRIQGWSYDDIGRAVRDLIESHEVFSFNVELASREGSFSDFAWIERRPRASDILLVGGGSEVSTDEHDATGLRLRWFVIKNRLNWSNTISK